MKRTMTLGLIMLATAACDNRQGARQEAGAAPPPSATPSLTTETADLATAASKTHKINVKLKKQGSKCVAEDPGTTTVNPGDYVRWKYKNQCGAKKKPKIKRKDAPIDGDCENETELEDGEDKEGKDCQVDPGATEGTYKYVIHGDGVELLDPELDILPPPPPQASAVKPTPKPK